MRKFGYSMYLYGAREKKWKRLDKTGKREYARPKKELNERNV